MISLDACISTLTLFNTRQLFQFSVKLLDLPTDGTHISRVNRGIFENLLNF